MAHELGRERRLGIDIHHVDRVVPELQEPGSWVMERKMLLTIKQRAEALASG